MSDEPLKVCPKCQGKLTKILYPTGVIFKGSGFYSTDYKAADKGASTNGSAPESKPQETKEQPKSDPKPESKSDSSD
jgi:predicted nucleic acid-binding Zn ribbon protein